MQVKIIEYSYMVSTTAVTMHTPLAIQVFHSKSWTTQQSHSQLVFYQMLCNNVMLILISLISHAIHILIMID
jgi:hypothetical protein